MAGFLLRILARLIALLPWRALPVLGRVLAWIAFDLLRIRRSHVDASMKRAGIAVHPREVYRQLGTSALELLWLSARSGPLPVRVIGMDRFVEARARGRGVIIATAHTGNWDLTACACAAITPLSVVTKRLSSRSIDRFWQETRAARGVDLIAAPDGGVLRAIRSRLREGRAVALLIDQDPERTASAVTAPFLGANAACDTLAPLIAARTGAPIVVAFASRDATGAHVVEIVDAIVPPDGADRAWIERTTRELAARLDAFVRTSPASWLWLHRRWKTQLT